MTLFAIDGEQLLALRRNRHLRRLVSALVEGDDAHDGELAPARTPPPCDLVAPRGAIEDWLSTRHPAEARWSPAFLDRYLHSIPHPRRPAAYLLAHEVIWTLGEATRLAFDALSRSGFDRPLPPMCRGLAYVGPKKHREVASDRILSPSQVAGLRRQLADALGGEEHDAVRDLLSVVRFMAEAAAPLTSSSPESCRGVVLVSGPPGATHAFPTPSP